MTTVFLGTEATATGAATPGELRYRYRRLFPNVYAPRDVEPTLGLRTIAASLWSGRVGVVTGRAAAAWHGAKWIDPDAPIELVYDCKRPPAGIVTRNERLAPDEFVVRGGVRVASVGRTAFDLGRFLPPEKAVAHLDALANRTGMTADDVLPLVERYRGARGTRKLRTAVDLMDAGAQSPKETWLRLLLIRNGFPRPTTQIPVYDDFGWVFGYLDMGWADLKIAVEYDGDHHRTDRVRYAWDVKCLRKIGQRGYLHIKVIDEDSEADIVRRVERAWAVRESALSVARRAS
ncbi:hypothetical protein ACQI4F_03610 [Mycolicibacterium vaccae]|uniref:hypothetical protein n=1 Tax=Mycolicibacterium vaccae TaxID=1810 RepID=UPI003CF3A9DC